MAARYEEDSSGGWVNLGDSTLTGPAFLSFRDFFLRAKVFWREKSDRVLAVAGRPEKTIAIPILTN
jgi:hypothetical protein